MFNCLAIVNSKTLNLARVANARQLGIVGERTLNTYISIMMVTAVLVAKPNTLMKR